MQRHSANQSFVPVLIGLGASLIAVLPASAQSHINSNAMEKTKFYQAPRQVQIVDDRPIIKDFRSAPDAPQMVQLPEAPQGFNNGFGGQGAGALGNASSVLPAGGLQLGKPSGVVPLGLPRAGFGSNLRNPAGALPNGTTTNRLMGKMMPTNKPLPAGAPQRRALVQQPRTNAPAPAVATYQRSYPSTSVASTSANASTNVRGFLLR